MIKRYRYEIKEFEEDVKKICGNVLPTVLPKCERIVAIGDIHGDLDLAIRSFKLAKLINDKFEWIGKNSIVIQVGDLIDSCRPQINPGCNINPYKNDVGQDMKVIEFFEDMHKKAVAKKGAVYSLLGNHEILNSQGIFDYVSYNNMNENRKELFEPGGDLAIKMACTRPVVLIIGSNLFVHGGLLPSLFTYEGNQLPAKEQLKRINHMIRMWLMKKLGPNDNIETLLDDPEISPFWSRYFGFEEANCKTADKLLKILKIGKIVIGHTPQESINSICDEAIFRIDGGFAHSFGYPRKIQVLEILNDYQYNILTE